MIIPALSCDGRECFCRAARSWWDTGPVLVAAKAAFNHTPAGADGIGVEDLPIIVAMITHDRLQGRGVLDRPPGTVRPCCTASMDKFRCTETIVQATSRRRYWRARMK
jgi:hypothetical protein